MASAKKAVVHRAVQTNKCSPVCWDSATPYRHAIAAVVREHTGTEALDAKKSKWNTMSNVLKECCQMVIPAKVLKANKGYIETDIIPSLKAIEDNLANDAKVYEREYSPPLWSQYCAIALKYRLQRPLAATQECIVPPIKPIRAEGDFYALMTTSMDKVCRIYPASPSSDDWRQFGASLAGIRQSLADWRAEAKKSGDHKALAAIKRIHNRRNAKKDADGDVSIPETQFSDNDEEDDDASGSDSDNDENKGRKMNDEVRANATIRAAKRKRDAAKSGKCKDKKAKKAASGDDDE